MITDSFESLGGVETYLTSVIAELKINGHDVRLFSSDISQPSQYISYYYRHINQKSLFKIFPYLFNIHSYTKLKKVLREFKPDIVHLHFTGYHSSPSIFLPLKKYPSVYTTHSHELYNPLTNATTNRCEHDYDSFCIYCIGILKIVPEKFRAHLINKFLSNIDLFIAPSNHHFKLLKKHKKNPSIQLVNAVAIPKNPSKMQYKYNLLFVGRLTKEKGVLIALQAFEIIHQKLPQATLTIIGEGSEKENLIKYVQSKDFAHAVFFEGQIRKEKINSFYENADIILVPSIYPEAFVLVGIEAMSIGRPVIGSRIGGIPEWLLDGETGYLVDPNNASQIADKALMLFSNKKLLTRMGKNAREKAESFSIDRHITELEKIYKRVIKKYSL